MTLQFYTLILFCTLNCTDVQNLNKKSDMLLDLLVFKIIMCTYYCSNACVQFNWLSVAFFQYQYHYPCVRIWSRKLKPSATRHETVPNLTFFSGKILFLKPKIIIS